LDRDRFEKLVADALEVLPQQLRERLVNIDISVDDEPTPEVLDEFDIGPEHLLMGLYTGVPLPERGGDYGMAMPDRILLFQSHIEAVCETDDQIAEEIQKTVVHEVAHYFGLEEDEIPEWAR